MSTTRILIIESPGKQKTIHQILAPLGTWRVVASMGHLRGLTPSLAFLQHDFEPTYEWMAEKSKAIAQLKEAVKGVPPANIYLAADRDYEGEQIAYSVCLLLRLNPRTAHRVTFTEITPRAILAAIESPGLIDMARVHTQQCRALLDLLIGYTLSPLLWPRIAPHLSAGRCQIPALRLLVDREDQIADFQADTSWVISGTWTSASSVFQAQLTDSLADAESCEAYLENIHLTATATVLDHTVTPTRESAPPPLITSTLQQQASALYRITPKQTMQIAQRLYEAGHITYMRTDHPVMSKDAVEAAKAYVRETYGVDYVAREPKGEPSAQMVVKGKRKEAKEAKEQTPHEAIRPTHFEVPALPQEETAWTSLDRAVYRMIWQRAIQSVMEDQRGERTTIHLRIDDDEDDNRWQAQQKRVLFPGWKRVGQVVDLEDEVDAEDVAADKDAAEEEKQPPLPLLGERVQWTVITGQQKETKARGRYTEATLVRALEQHGIGRPSTFASLLTTLHERGYSETKSFPARLQPFTTYTLRPQVFPPTRAVIQKKVGAEHQKIVPTPLGRAVLSFLLEHFADVFAYEYTARMEQRLDRIAGQEEDWKDVLRELWSAYRERYESLRGAAASSAANDEKESAVAVAVAADSRRQREFGEGLKAVMSKKGPLLLREGADAMTPTIFYGWPAGRITFETITREQAEAFVAERQDRVLGTYQDLPVIQKTGKFGGYVQWGDIRMNDDANASDRSFEALCEQLETKRQAASSAKESYTFKDIVIRKGPYGYYMMKPGLKKAVFVSLPDMDPTAIPSLTQAQVESYYRAGREAKSANHAKSAKGAKSANASKKSS